MPLNKEFITGVFDGATDDQIEKVMKEFESDVTGLKVNRDQVLSESKSYKEKLEKLNAEHGVKEKDFQKRIEELEASIKASGTDELKAYYEAEKKKLQEMHVFQSTENEKKFAALEAEKSGLYAKYMEVLKNTELDKALDKIQNLDRTKANMLRDVFWQRNKFEVQSVDGVEKIINQEFRSIGDVLNALIATDEGKFFLQANSTGGGATGSTGAKPQIGNPFIKGKENLDEQGRLFKENKGLYDQLKAQAEALTKGA